MYLYYCHITFLFIYPDIPRQDSGVFADTQTFSKINEEHSAASMDASVLWLISSFHFHFLWSWTCRGAPPVHFLTHTSHLAGFQHRDSNSLCIDRSSRGKTRMQSKQHLNRYNHTHVMITDQHVMLQVSLLPFFCYFPQSNNSSSSHIYFLFFVTHFEAFYLLKSALVSVWVSVMRVNVICLKLSAIIQ